MEHAVYRRGDAQSFLHVGAYVDDLVITRTKNPRNQQRQISDAVEIQNK